MDLWSQERNNQDSMYINKQMKEFADMTSNIRSVTKELFKSIGEITHVIEDSAVNVEDAAKGTVVLNEEIEKIQKDMNISEEVALQMKTQCERFENV